MTIRTATTAIARGMAVAAIAAAVLGIAAVASAEPTPSPSPSRAPEDLIPANPGVTFGIGDWITKQVNAWFAQLAALAVKPLLTVLASTLLATPDYSTSGRVFDIWKSTAAIANSGFLLLATIGAITAMGHQTVQTRYAVKEVLPRLGLAVLVTNVSFQICGKAIEFANALSFALLGGDFDADRAATSIRTLIVLPGNSQIFYTLLELVAVILLVLLLVTFIMRSALVLLLVVGAPLALACHALPYTNGVARFWWRAFSGLLLIQVAQSLTLTLAVRIFFNQDGRLLLGIAPTGQLVNLLLAICLLIILVRIPSWISRSILIGGGRSSAFTRIVKSVVAYKLTAPLLAGLHLGRGRQGGGRKAITSAAAGRVVAGAIGGPAGSLATTAITAASASSAGPRPIKHAPTGAVRPVRAEDWEPAPVKHAPTAPAIQGKYRPTPKRKPPVPATTPVYGYPRETFYARGPAGLGQMMTLQARAQQTGNTTKGTSPAQRPAQPIVSLDAPIPGQPNWPAKRRTTPRRARPRPRKPRGGDGT